MPFAIVSDHNYATFIMYVLTWLLLVAMETISHVAYQILLTNKPF